MKNITLNHLYLEQAYSQQHMQPSSVTVNPDLHMQSTLKKLPLYNPYLPH